MENKYQIKIPSGGPQYPETDKDWFQLPINLLAIAKKNSGKTASLSNFLHIMHRMNKLDMIILISPTWRNNSHYFKGLPVMHVIQPTLESSDEVIKIVENEALEFDNYHERLEKWKELQVFLKSRKNMIDIDENLLLYFSEDMKKPVPKYPGGRKPIIFAMYDDCLSTPAFSPKSSLGYLAIKHRHIGETKNFGSISCNLLIATQAYTSNNNGVPKSVRANCNIICVFANKSKNEIDLIADEAAGEISSDLFHKLHEEATSKPFGFLTIDFTKKSNHPSMFRQNWNKFLLV